MSYLNEGTSVAYDGVEWKALDLTWSRHLDYHGPSVVESPKGRLYADAYPDGTVHLKKVVTKTEGKRQYAEPGEEVGVVQVDPKGLFESDAAQADPTCEGDPTSE